MNQILVKVNQIKAKYMLKIPIAIIISAIVVHNIVNHNYIYATLFFIASLTFAVFVSTKIALMLLFFLGFVGHQIIPFGAPAELIYCWDLIVLLLFIKTLFTISLSPHSIMLTGLQY